MYLIAWLNANPYCWAASIDGGKTWYQLNADNDEDSSEAIDEASRRFGSGTNQWDIQDEPIKSALKCA